METHDKILLFGVVPVGIAGVIYLTTHFHSTTDYGLAEVSESVSHADTPAIENLSTAESLALSSDLLAPPTFIEPSARKMAPNPAEQLAIDAPTFEPVSKSAPKSPDAPVSASRDSGEPGVAAFPTAERIWTNSSGKIMLASVLDYNISEGTVLLRTQQGKLIPNYQVSQLSRVDRDFLKNLSGGKN